MKWLMRELAIWGISVFILVPMLIVMVARVPFAAIWSLLFDEDGLEEQ